MHLFKFFAKIWSARGKRFFGHTDKEFLDFLPPELGAALVDDANGEPALNSLMKDEDAGTGQSVTGKNSADPRRPPRRS